MNRAALGLTLMCLTFVFAFFITVPEGAVADEGDTPEPSPITNLKGYVYDIPAQEERVVISGVQVTTWISTDKEYQTVTTNSDGEFILEYNSDIRFISFNIAEYTVKGWCSELRKYGDTGVYEIVLKDDSQSSGVHDLFDDSGYTVMVSRTNAMVFGTVTTIIENSTVPLSNATVMLISSKAMISSTTDDTGYFNINCASGVEYTLTITKGGFEVWSEDVQPSDEPIAVNMVQKNHSVILGLDMTHTIELFGILITLLIAIVAIYFMRRPAKENGVRVVNDIMPLDDDDDDRDE